MEKRFVDLAAKIVAAYAANNVVPREQLPALIRKVQLTLSLLDPTLPKSSWNISEALVLYRTARSKPANHYEGGVANEEMVRLDMRTVAMECLELVRPMAEKKGLELSMAVAPGTQRELNADPVRFRQVLINLLDNAVKFTTQGAVELRLRPVMDGSMLRIEVTDTGPGISTDQKQRLSDYLKCVDGAAVQKAPNVRLGLALSAQLAGQMGGRFGHDSNPGGGSVFWLELTLDNIGASITTMAPISKISTSGRVSRPGRALHVLIVDDSRMIRELTEAILARAGHRTTCVSSGMEAIIAVEKGDSDVVLMDIRMPIMDGVETTRCIRSLEGPRRLVPILAVTSQDYPEYIARCRKAGMDGHLTKPFDPVRLNTIILQAASARHAHGEKLAWLGSEPVAKE